MRPEIRLATLMLGVGLLTSPAGAGEPIDWPQLDGARKPESGRLVSGQPAPHELIELERAGVEHVFNAREPGELDAWDQPAAVGALGLEYHSLPIGGADDLDRAAVERFDRIVESIGDDPALFHCASGNRVGALFALRAGWLEGKDTETAIEIGEAHGLTRLEPAVRDKLSGG
jgi:uncharacterized protein (TIGR01244 family)